MRIDTAQFVKSVADAAQCPAPDKPEYAFIGRSNVGKSSLINMLVDRKSLAKTSSTPGKTKLINYFIINDAWYLVDLPGLGFAKVSKRQREAWQIHIAEYLRTRKNLLTSFLLIDCRLTPQAIDIEFMEWMAAHALPFEIVFTKIDKLNSRQLIKNIQNYKDFLLRSWQELPNIFLSSGKKKQGRDDILHFIAETNKIMS